MAGGIRVLVVDDSVRTRQSLLALFTTCTQVEETRTAADAGTAISIVEQWLPDTILMDVQMPGMDGIAATKIIKGRWPQVRVVAHSVAAETAPAALAAGADAFIGKGELAECLIEAILASTKKS
jgi:CheY-like chemotaxis protein